MPSKNDNPRGGWFKWSKEHNPNLLVKVAHGLEVGHVKGLCPTNVESFYTNLPQEYNLHNYMPKCIWNCNESNAPIGWNCEAHVLAKNNSRFMHSITPDWGSRCSSCLFHQPIKECLPNFYVFKGK
jgi:hypothetical protein